MHHFHLWLLPTTTNSVSVARRAGNVESLTLVLKGNNPRFPWKPSTTMLTYKLTGTTEASGSTAANTSSVHPSPQHGQPQPATNLRPPRCANGAAMLTCGFALESSSKRRLVTKVVRDCS
jgi:hypothetical protein